MPDDEAVSGAEPTGRELLEQAAVALMDCATVALAVQSDLDQPYRDDPRWSPWTRWVEPRAQRAHDLAITIRKHLRETPPPGHAKRPPRAP